MTLDIYSVTFDVCDACIQFGSDTDAGDPIVHRCDATPTHVSVIKESTTGHMHIAASCLDHLAATNAEAVEMVSTTSGIGYTISCFVIQANRRIRPGYSFPVATTLDVM